jgi:putative radical SAM enzyme (TIGR03279 family)
VGAESAERGAAAGASLPVAAVQDAAKRAGLRPGDCITRVDGVAPHDVLDLEMAAADGAFWLAVLRDGHPLDVRVEPRSGEWHGISLDYDGLGAPARVCRNRCRFCFVDQVPAGLRPALSVKDDDYRLSFLHGNFMTLTNLAEGDLARIEALRLSPLYVSLHAWDDAARVRLMGRAAAGSRAALERLAAAGLELHLQVVCCPGWNDGAVLAQTVERSAALPGVADLGIVPVSLAAQGDLRRVTLADAEAVLAAVAGWQDRYREERGVAFVHAADEFHLLCGRVPPPSDAPEQYENGIGMAALFAEEAAELVSERRGASGCRRAAAQRPRAGAARLLCGSLAEPVVAPAAESLADAFDLRLRAFSVENHLFGPHVTVTGLLGGQDVLDALRADPLAADEWLIAPRVFLPAGLGRTLDDVGEDELTAACGGRLLIGESLREAFATLSG